jgi:hypothetical protein
LCEHVQLHEASVSLRHLHQRAAKLPLAFRT